MKVLEKERVVAVLVTYNRKYMLIECLNGLLRQTYPLEAIYIIDNASTDGTPEYLLEKGFIDEICYPDKEPLEKVKMIPLSQFTDKTVRIHYVRMHENTGGAGGFYEGVKRCYKAGYDWLWLMDDDVKPIEDALERLLKYKNISLCIHPRKIFKDGSPHEWEGYLDITTGEVIMLGNISFKNGKKWVEVNYGCFEGMLIHRDIISKVGFPNKDFFIVYDDTLYGLQCSMYTNVIYVNEPVLLYQIKKEWGKKIFDRRFWYYKIRNSFLMERYINDIFHTNFSYKYYLLKTSIFQIIKVIRLRKNIIKNCYSIMKGFYDGYRMSKAYKPSIKW